jgi:hypothetical protein
MQKFHWRSTVLRNFVSRINISRLKCAVQNKNKNKYEKTELEKALELF